MASMFLSNDDQENPLIDQHKHDQSKKLRKDQYIGKEIQLVFFSSDDNYIFNW